MATVQFKSKGWLSITRKINAIDDMKPMIKYLGYSRKELDELWAIDSPLFHDMKSHPIEKIIDEETKKQFKKTISGLGFIINTLVNAVGVHYIPQPIVYLHKKGHKVPAISYNKVTIEEGKKLVLAKVEFLNIE